MPTPPPDFTDGLYTRRDVTAMTQLSENQLKSRLATGHLPTVDRVITSGSVSYAEADGSVTMKTLQNADVRPWANLYTFRDVVGIAVYGALWIGNDVNPGLASETACEIVNRNRWAIIEACAQEGTEADDIWLGYIWYPPPVKAGALHAASHTGGTLQGVMQELSGGSSRGERPSSFTLVNVSEALRQVRARAKEAGIPLPPPAHI